MEKEERREKEMEILYLYADEFNFHSVDIWKALKMSKLELQKQCRKSLLDVHIQ